MFESLEYGVLGQLFDRDAAMRAGKAAIGGTAASVLYEMAIAKVSFFSDANANIDMAKKVGLAALVALGGGMLLEKQGQSEMAMGAAGAVGAVVGKMLLTKAGVLNGCPGCVGSLASMPSYPALAGSTFHDEDVLGIRVGTEDPEFAGLFSAAGAY